MGVPLGVLSLVTLTLQNSALTIVLHYVSRSIPAWYCSTVAEELTSRLLLEHARFPVSFRVSSRASRSQRTRCTLRHQQCY